VDTSSAIGIVGILLGVIVTILVSLFNMHERSKNQKLALQEIEIYEKWEKAGNQEEMSDLKVGIDRRIHKINNPLGKSFTKNIFLIIGIIYFVLAGYSFFITKHAGFVIAYIIIALAAIAMHFASTSGLLDRYINRILSKTVLRKKVNTLDDTIKGSIEATTKALNFDEWVLDYVDSLINNKKIKKNKLVVKELKKERQDILKSQCFSQEFLEKLLEQEDNVKMIKGEKSDT